VTDPGVEHEVLEKAKISQLMANWAAWRDCGDWARLRTTYTPDATMVTSWFDGTATAFIDSSEKMFATASGRLATYHLIGASSIEVRGDRGTAETRMSVLIRLPVHGIDSDVTAIGRFHDQLLKTEMRWQIQRRVAVFDKDSLHPVDPSVTLRLDQTQLTQYPEAYRFCCYALASRGLKINTNLPAPNAFSMNSLYAESRAWLLSG
jgi:ketosteroid isomerase-like protein